MLWISILLRSEPTINHGASRAGLNHPARGASTTRWGNSGQVKLSWAFNLSIYPDTARSSHRFQLLVNATTATNRKPSPSEEGCRSGSSRSNRTLNTGNRAGKSDWGGSEGFAEVGKWLPASTWYLTSIVNHTGLLVQAASVSSWWRLVISINLSFSFLFIHILQGNLLFSLKWVLWFRKLAWEPQTVTDITDESALFLPGLTGQDNGRALCLCLCDQAADAVRTLMSMTFKFPQERAQLRRWLFDEWWAWRCDAFSFVAGSASTIIRCVSVLYQTPITHSPSGRRLQLHCCLMHVFQECKMTCHTKYIMKINRIRIW